MLAGFEAWITERGVAYLLIQLVGVVASAFGILSYQCKTRRNIMLMQLVSCVFWATHLYLLGAVTGVLLNLVGLLQRAVYAAAEKYEWAKKNRFWIPLFILLYAGATAYAWHLGDGAKSLLPFAGMFIFIFTALCKSPKNVRILCFFSSPFWLMYNLLSFSISGVLTEAFNMLSAVVAFVRLDRKKNAE